MNATVANDSATIPMTTVRACGLVSRIVVLPLFVTTVPVALFRLSPLVVYAGTTKIRSSSAAIARMSRTLSTRARTFTRRPTSTLFLAWLATLVRID